MKRFAALITLLISGVASASSASKPDPDRIWITDVVIISPDNLDHVQRGSVLIEHGLITRVERSHKAKRPKDATVFSAKGQYLIPGLMDSHVHVSSIPGLNPDQVNPTQPLARSYSEHEALAASYLKQLPRSYLYYGYTTLVDLVAPSPQELNDFRKEPLHPDLYSCNPSMPFANGYPMSYAPPEQRFTLFPNFIYDPAQAASIPPQYKPEDHTPAADVARVKNAGGICVKTFFERGFGGVTNLPVMTPDVLSEIRGAGWMGVQCRSLSTPGAAGRSSRARARACCVRGRRGTWCRSGVRGCTASRNSSMRLRWSWPVYVRRRPSSVRGKQPSRGPLRPIPVGRFRLFRLLRR